MPLFNRFSNALALYYYRIENKIDKAITVYEDLLPRVERAIAPDHPYRIEVVSNLAKNYLSAGRHRDAFVLLQDFLKGQSRKSDLLAARSVFFEACMAENDTVNAETTAFSQIASARERLEAGSLDLCNDLSESTAWLLRLEKWEVAEPLIRESLAIRQKLSALHWRTFDTQLTLAKCLRKQNRLAEANVLLDAAEVGLSQFHDSSIFIRRQLFDSLMESGLPDSARQLADLAVARANKFLKDPNARICELEFASTCYVSLEEWGNQTGSVSK